MRNYFYLLQTADKNELFEIRCPSVLTIEEIGPLLRNHSGMLQLDFYTIYDERYYHRCKICNSLVQGTNKNEFCKTCKELLQEK